MTKPSDLETPSMSLWRENDRQLARCYTIHGVLVGGVLCLIVANNPVGTTMNRNFESAAALLQPLPMFIAAAALWYGWRWARWPSVCLPLLVALCCIERLLWLFGLSIPRYRDPFAIFGDLQMVNIPGATIFAIVTAYNMLWEPPISRPKGQSENRG
jgi:hypothetical protein